MRYLPDVIDNMLSEIPPNRNVLINSLKDIKESVTYSSPELIGMWWRRGAEILMDELGDIPLKESWQGKVVDIWMGR